MKPAYSQAKSKRIFFYYSLAVLLPGIVLGALAFRGIRNDQALREKQARQELNLLSQELFTGMSRSLEELLNADPNTHSITDSAVLVRMIRKDTGALQVTENHMAFLPASLLPDIPLTENPPELEPGWVLEFRERDFEEAGRFYERLVDFETMRLGDFETLRGELRARVWVALGRIYRNMGKMEKAMEAYQVLADSFPRVALGDGMPLGTTALMELSRLQYQDKNEQAAKQTADRCVKTLLDGGILLGEDVFGFLYRTLRELPVKPDTALMAQLELQKFRAANLATIIEGLPPLLSRDAYRNIFLDAKELPAMLVQGTAPDGTRRGLIVDLNFFTLQQVEGFLSRPDAAGTISLRISSENGSLLVDRSGPGEEPYLEFPFPTGLPPWKLGLRYNPQNFVSVLFGTQQGLFIFVFIFIVLLMIAGLIFVLRTLNQEMRLSKLKSDFISNVSHEFRTPLTSLRHMTEIMYLKRIDSESRKEEYLQSMLEQCDHLGHLIENILDFSRIEQNKKSFRFGEYDLNEIILDLIPVFRSRIPEPDFELIYVCPDPPPSMRIDKDAMQQVFYNLLDNAYKYSGKGKRIEITMEKGERRKAGVGVRVRVRDFGIGISERELPRIFERFYRADRLRTEGIKGSGIGLTIVKQIVEAHGGEVVVESTPGQGSVFTVTLPIDQHHDTNSDH